MNNFKLIGVWLLWEPWLIAFWFTVFGACAVRVWQGDYAYIIFCLIALPFGLMAGAMFASRICIEIDRARDEQNAKFWNRIKEK